MIRSTYLGMLQRWSVRDAGRRGLLELDEGVTFSPRFQLKLHGDLRPQLRIGKRTHMDGRLVIRGSGRISIGAYCSFRVNTYLGAVDSIEIGSHVFGAEGVFIVDNNNHPVAPEARRAMTMTPMGSPLWDWTAPGVDSAPVVLEDNVWVGRNASILKGVRIGAGSIVALGAVVTKSVARLSVVAGNPGRVVRTIESGASAVHPV